LCGTNFEMYELLIGRHLFNTEAKTHWTEEDDHLAQMLEITNTASFPVDMRAGKRGDEFFNETGD
jgi:hypothetical protein